MKHFLAALFCLMAARTRAAESAVSFTKDVAPILVAKCLSCHNADKAKGGYRLHTFDALLKPGSSKDAPVVVAQPAQSKLIQLLTAKDEDDRMPQKDDPLPSTQIAVVQKWIQQGAKFDGAERSLALAVLSPPQHPAAPQSYAVPLPITALAFDVSGEHLAASGYHEITIWNSRSGALVQRLGHVAERTFDLTYSPDGAWLACASGTPGRLGEVKLFQATNGQLAKTLTTIGDAVLCLAFSPDGARLAAGGADNVIRVWSIPSGRLEFTIEQHADWVLALAFNPSGAFLASGSRDKSARLFDMKTGELDETHTGHGDFVPAVAWADDKFVISASREKIAHRWKATDAKKAGEFSGWDAAPTRLIVSGTNLFSSALDGVVRQHNLGTREITRTFSGATDALYSLAVHASTQRLAAGSHDGEVRVWNLEDGETLLHFSAAPGYTPKLSRAK